MVEETLSLAVGSKQASAFMTVPDGGRGPGVLLAHAWWGLNGFLKETARRLAREGFLVLAPDYYEGRVASTIEAAKGLRSLMDREQASMIVTQGLEHLLTLPQLSLPQVATMGFSLGCGFVLELARSKPQVVAAVVLFYGTGGGKFDRARADFLGHFAQTDEWGAHPEKVEALRVRLSASGREVIFHSYPGTGHWFFEQDQPSAYNQAAADQAWERTLAFLRQRLHP